MVEYSMSMQQSEPEMQRQAWIALSAVKGIGRKTLVGLREALQRQNITAMELWQGTPTVWTQCGLQPAQQKALRVFRQEYLPQSYAQMLEEKGIVVVLLGESMYPQLLAEIADPPEILYVKNACAKSSAKPSQSIFAEASTLHVAVVGSRHMTAYGQLATEKLVGEFVQAGACVVSGFMYGVDLCAHAAAVRMHGRTLGVLGFGFDHFYPATEKPFFEEFLSSGNTLITEFAPSVAPKAGNFPVRNRIVAGLSQAVVVVEAALGSGSLITAQLALDYGRQVWAVSGPITSIYSEGTKNLINQGAKLITTAWEVVEDLRPQLPRSVVVQSAVPQLQQQNLTFPEKICLLLRQHALTIAQLQDALQQPIENISAALSMLEVYGKVQKRGGSWVAMA
jgi:DNA processing protein